MPSYRCKHGVEHGQWCHICNRVVPITSSFFSDDKCEHGVPLGDFCDFCGRDVDMTCVVEKPTLASTKEVKRLKDVLKPKEEYEYEQTWEEWEREDPPSPIVPKGGGWRMVGVVSPWRGHIVWVWERRKR